MQLLCNIPDKLYRKWEVSDFSLQESLEFVRCVINGKPLSKNVTNGEVLCILFPNMHNISELLDVVACRVEDKEREWEERTQND